MEMKYFKPKSISWWSSVAPLVAGLLIATAPLTGLATVASVLVTITGGISPAVLINAGLAGIGFRGASG